MKSLRIDSTPYEVGYWFTLVEGQKLATVGDRRLASKLRETSGTRGILSYLIEAEKKLSSSSSDFKYEEWELYSSFLYSLSVLRKEKTKRAFIHCLTLLGELVPSSNIYKRASSSLQKFLFFCRAYYEYTDETNYESISSDWLTRNDFGYHFLLSFDDEEPTLWYFQEKKFFN